MQGQSRRGVGGVCEASCLGPMTPSGLDGCDGTTWRRLGPYGSSSFRAHIILVVPEAVYDG